MSKNWSNSDSNQEMDPIESLLSEWSDPEEEEQEFRSDFFKGIEGRRAKALFMLMMIWAIVITLHLVSWGFWCITTVMIIFTLSMIRLVLTPAAPLPSPLSKEELSNGPFVSLLVAAKNEEAVIARLVKGLCQIDYPIDRYELWVVDDRSTDRTPEILAQLQTQYPQLKVLTRAPGAGGGKSGALNEVLPLTKGELIGVFDADATVTPDLLRRLVPLFKPKKVGAVQMRKAITNHDFNFWTKGQEIEMAADSYLQQKRIAVGGIGELRGNGQFVRRQALASCGGWNEETITDDLDLTIRLHLDQWDIAFCETPAVYEEGVTSAQALWHQRSRWAEGGYQRYLDYWRLIMSNGLGFVKTFDLITFVLIQYLIPTASIADLVMVLTRHHLPILMPLSTLLFIFMMVVMLLQLYKMDQSQNRGIFKLVSIVGQSILGILYMTHWLIVMPCTTGRMSILPKRLKWVKTHHEGSGEEQFEIS